MKYKLQKSPEEVLELVKSSVTRARNWVDDVEWSAEDGTRTEIDFLCACVETAIKAGATTINIPDTVGYTTPDEYRALFRTVRERVPNSDKAIFSVHCHNDLGMAVANTLAGLEGGARQVECTINGIGERAGNAALEEIVMAIRTRSDVLPYETGIETAMLNRASKLVATATSFPVQYNKAIVGRNAFAHESGIHQDGMLKHTQTYEIMTPESVGVSKTSLVMGKHSGRAAFRSKLKEMGYDLGDNQLEDAFTRFKTLTDRKKHVYDEDIEALVDEIMLVSERSLEEAVSLLLQIEKTVVEGAGAAGLAALMTQPERFRGKTVGVILTGGNIDTRLLANVLLRDLARSGRLARLRIRLQDRPGALYQVARIFQEQTVNILELSHQRIFTNLPAKGLSLDVECETRDRAHLERLISALQEAGYEVRLIELA